tara:strand:+ start:3669 stop:4205 length:537 start_codon:yes stop_codon:yes gene_type:complete
VSAKRIVIIGGPSTGKTTLIDKLEKKGYTCLEEISRQVTREAQEQGIAQLFLTQPLLFSQKLLEKRITQFRYADGVKDEYVFYDRGLPDVLAYMDYAGQQYPENFIKACKDYTYNKVFVLPPWKEIHTTDGERYESFEQATAIQEHLLKTYNEYGYTPIEVPRAPVSDRMQFILKNMD